MHATTETKGINATTEPESIATTETEITATNRTGINAETEEEISATTVVEITATTVRRTAERIDPEAGENHRHSNPRT